MNTTPLAVLDLVPITSGSTPAKALRNSIDLVRACEYFGYTRYWFAEHHLNPGLAGTSPAVLLALTAGATSRIRLGSGAVQMGHRAALSTVEEFGLIDALHRGRLDLGLGRSPGARPRGEPLLAGVGGGPRAANGLRRAMQRALLQPPGASPQDYAVQVADVLALLRGTYRSADGVEGHAIPGEGADVQVWILGSSGGESARVAGANGLRFAANYHVSPATVLAATEVYRAAFRPSAELDRPYLSVSADVVVAPSEAEARELATGYGLWVRSIRAGGGRDPVPDPGGGTGARLVGRRLGAGRRPGRDAVRGQPGAGRERAGAAPRRGRRRRADYHDDHPRPRRPGPFLPAARHGMAPPLTCRWAAGSGNVEDYPYVEV